MDLSTLTPEQRACVEHVNGPLLVSAGAGSGKTFMLTQRIAYALLNPETSGVTDIEQVLAITFTDLAASEIKARVRNKLREEGLGAQALKVDASWISTIHGMCSRILRENALDLGIDPGFTLLGETDRNQLLADCIDRALVEAENAGTTYKALFAEFDATGAYSVANMLGQIVNAAANVRGGLGAIACREPERPHEIACDMLDAMVALDATAREGIGVNGKAKDTFTVSARDALENPETGMRAYEQLAAKRDCSYQDIATALVRTDISFGSRTRKEPYATAYAQFRSTYIRLCQEAAFGLALPARTELLALASRTQELFDSEKKRQGALDQNDLLLKTLAAFEENPSVRERYSKRFRLVMVDEFQDTSGLQIALINHLTNGDRTLCTVGDTQQSIYRFRGADVDTYRRHKEHMRTLGQIGGMYCELGKNWRSHGDVIEFVNTVFGAPEVFGSDEFIELGYDKTHEDANAFPDVPRIDVVCTSHRYNDGVGTADLHLVEAEAIARRFIALHDTGSKNCRWGDMVILLGAMSNADVYARTLRAHGIPCIITGGSGFSKTPEALEVCALLKAVANPLDNEALKQALSGAAFGLGGDELLRLATTEDMHRRDLWDGLKTGRTTDPSPRTQLAAEVLCRAVGKAGQQKAAELLTDVVLESGWLDRLQGQGPQGMAAAANVLKCIRLAEQIESDPAAQRGLPATAARLALELAQGIKEKPGTLMVEGQDAVRILTVHASKGLEFPVVALADFYGLKPQRGCLLLETVGETINLSLKPGATIAAGSGLEDLLSTKLSDTQASRLREEGFDAENTLEDADSAAAFHTALVAHARAEELGELRRKFYVGATRPREALIVAVNGRETKDRTWSDVVGDLCQGLFGIDGDFYTTPEGIDFGGKHRAMVQRIKLTRDSVGTLYIEGEGASEGTPAQEFLHPAMVGQADAQSSPMQTERIPEAPHEGEHVRDLLPGLRPCDPLRTGVFSYTAIAQGEAAEDRAAPQHTDYGTDSEDVVPRREDPRAFGSAVHQACELATEALLTKRGAVVGTEDSPSLETPSDERLASCLAAWGLDKTALPALRTVIERWAGSRTARLVENFGSIQPEAPFYAALQGPQGEPIHLEGSIDLLCWEPTKPLAEQTALVVDYKTGGHAHETPDELVSKHALQAACYAYAVLLQGFEAVDLRFVRLEQLDPTDDGAPQEVAYRYERSDLQGLEETVRTAYARSR